MEDAHAVRLVDVIQLNYGHDGIMYAHILKNSDDQVEVQKKASKAIGEMTAGKKVPLLIEYEGIFLPSLEARDYWAKEDSTPFTKAEAYVMKWLPMKLIGNFYLNFNKPPRPTRIFNNRDEALIWLKTFL